MKRFGVNLGAVCLTLTIFLLAPGFVQAQMMKKGGGGIVVNCPRPHQCVTSPISVQGKAKAPWFSDGSFNMTLVDDKGNQISSGTVKAQGDWQKAKGFIPFAGKMDFSVDKTTKAKLVLEGEGSETGMKTQPQTMGQSEGGMQKGAPAGQQGQPGTMEKGMPATGQAETGMGKGKTAGQPGGLKKEIPVVLSAGKPSGKTPQTTPETTPGMK